MDKTDSASGANVLLLSFILWTRPITSMMQLDGVRIASAGDNFSQAPWQVRFCLFYVGTHLQLPVPMAVGPVGGPGHPHVYTSTLSYHVHLAEEVSVSL